jgi:hypothetical protein
MNCYVCAQTQVERAAVGLCHNCSAALCGDHAIETSQDVVTYALLNREVILPKKARELFCGVCEAALHQSRRAG